MFLNFITNYRPLDVLFKITYSCNLKCKQCNIWYTKKYEEELNQNEWKKQIIFLKNG